MNEGSPHHFPILIPEENEGLEPFLRRSAESLRWPKATAGADIASIRGMLERHLAPDEQLSVASRLFRAISFTAAPSMAISHMVRYIDALGEKAHEELLALRDNSEHLHFMCSLFAFSDFLSEQVIVNTDILRKVFRDPGLDQVRTVDVYTKRLIDKLSNATSEGSFHSLLVDFKNRELVRIAIRDLLEKGNAEALCRELSNLAEVIVRIALARVIQGAIERYGKPTVEVAGAVHGFVVYAMGKFGGGELNFSSDIDLVFIYDAEGQTEGVPDITGKRTRIVSNHEFYDYVGRQLVDILSRRTASGFLFRVDMRLRPEGASGPLVRSRSALSAYFGGHAAIWEKIAWLKARFVAGDAATAEKIDPVITQFVYTNNRAELILPEVARLKHRIDFDALNDETRALDIKRGTGGIREIEFVICARQILLGEQYPELRIRPTIAAARLLAELDVIPPKIVEDLIEAYWFFRQIEHTLQMMHESQTHQLPADKQEREVLALRCGYSKATEFETLLAQRRQFVRAQFEELFGQEDASQPLSLADYLFGDSDPPDSVLTPLKNAGLEPRSGFDALRRLAVGTQDFAPSAKAQMSFQQLLPAILEELPGVAMPDQAVRQFDLLLRSAGGYTWVYDLCLTNTHILKLFLRVLGFGSLLARQLCAHPEWIDELLVNQGLHEDRLDIRLEKLPSILEKQETASNKYQALRVFKQLEGFLLCVQEILAIASSADIAERMARLAEHCLRHAAEIARDQALAAYSITEEPTRWCVVALGGLGDRSVHFSGDVDIFFAIEENKSAGTATTVEWADKLARQLVNEFAALTPEGQLWKIDARLRPDGRNSPIAASRERFLEYYRTEAGTWEWQALTKARVVAGDKEFGQALLNDLYSVFGEKQGINQLAEEIHTMRQRIDESFRLPSNALLDLKRSPGGIVDVEFLVQYEILKRPTRAAELFPLTTFQAIEALTTDGAFSPDEATTMADHLRLLRTCQRALRLLFETTTDFYPADPERAEALRRGLSDQLVGRLHDVDNLAERCSTQRLQFEKLIQR